MKRLPVVLAVVVAAVVVVALGPPLAGATPTSLAPTNGAQLPASAQSFTWQDSLAQGPIDHWYLEISTSPDVDYYPWGFFSGNLAFSAGSLKRSSVNLNTLGRALSPGTYYWHVVGYYGAFGSLGTAWSPVQSFTVFSSSATAPTIAVNPAALSFAVEQGDLTWHARSIAISNTGGGALLFTAQGGAVGWLGIASGTNTGYVYTLPVGVRGTDNGVTPKAIGTYTSQVTVFDNGSVPAATNSPKIVPVTLQVLAADGTPPWGASISIARGAVATKTPDVVLTLSAADAGSGIGDMRFNDGCAGWSNWIPYATARGWRLPSGDGIKTVQKQFRDRVGNEGAVASDTIVLDTRKPTPKAPYGAAVRRGRTVSLRYKVVDPRPGSPTATVTIRIKTLKGKTVKKVTLKNRKVNTLLKYTFRCKLKKRIYRFYVYARDTAGNTQTKAARNTLRVR